MVRYNYIREFAPPAPFAYVTAASPDGSAGPGEWPAQLDTGADRTVVPLQLARDLGLAETGLLRLEGLGGHPTAAPLFVVRLGVRGLVPALVEVVAVSGEPHILLGRDVLNRHRVVLDGPRLACEID